MNILSKILVVVFISISSQSISAQDHVNEVSTDGIVQVWNTNSPYFSTGFFIGPHTLVTAFYNIGELEGEVSENLSIAHPVTGRWIPVHSIQAIHPVYDLAVLHIKDYESPVYYELFEGSEESLSSSEAYLFDRTEESFPIIGGTLSLQYHFEKHYRKTLEFFDTDIHLTDLSGSPIFSKEGEVIGVLPQQRTSHYSIPVARFPHIKNVKKLLLEPSLNCQSGDCVREEAFSLLRKERVNTDGIVTVNHKLKNKDSHTTIGTGFFVGPHTLVTSFYFINKLQREVSDNLFIIHPKTEEHIPVHSIQVADFDNDLAVLHISEYESPVYYELFEGSEESLSSSEAYVLDHRDAFFHKFEGTLSPQYHFENHHEKTLEFFNTLLSLYDLNGSPIFSKEGKVIGVLTRRVSSDISQKLHFHGEFSHIEAVKKLLLTPSLNCQSKQDCIQKDFFQNSKFTDGVVPVSNKVKGRGTGFFIGPHTLVTAWHVVDKFEGEVSDNLFIEHPHTKKFISVHSIQAVHLDDDLAVLHIKDYESPVYYELFEGSEESLSSSEVYVFNRKDASFPKLEGTLSPEYHSETHSWKKLNFFDNDLKNLPGLSGSPVFSKDDKVIGVLAKGMEVRILFFKWLYGRFTNTEAVKELLLQPSLNCQSRDCIKEEDAPDITVRDYVNAIKGLFRR